MTDLTTLKKQLKKCYKKSKKYSSNIYMMCHMNNFNSVKVENVNKILNDLAQKYYELTNKDYFEEMNKKIKRITNKIETYKHIHYSFCTDIEEIEQVMNKLTATYNKNKELNKPISKSQTERYFKLKNKLKRLNKEYDELINKLSKKEKQYYKYTGDPYGATFSEDDDDDEDEYYGCSD